MSGMDCMFIEGLRRVLIVGLRELDAGKTTVAQALLFLLRDKGVMACGFKPKAGNTLWYDYDVVYEALSRGRLYGKDSMLLRNASSGGLCEELVNPIHKLWATPPPRLKPDLIALPYFIVDRISLWAETPREIVVVNDALPFRYGKEGLVAKLFKPGVEVLRIETVQQFNEVVNTYYNRAIELAHRKISALCDALVYESYADVALPWEGVRNLDVVLAVCPGYVFAYDPDKYLSALKLSTGLLKEEKSVNVVNLLKPLKTLELSPYRTDEIVEKVKRKLCSFLEAL